MKATQSFFILKILIMMQYALLVSLMELLCNFLCFIEASEWYSCYKKTGSYCICFFILWRWSMVLIFFSVRWCASPLGVSMSIAINIFHVDFDLTSPFLPIAILDRTGICIKISSKAESLIWRTEVFFTFHCLS
jgi:hypothetical protein